MVNKIMINIFMPAIVAAIVFLTIRNNQPHQVLVPQFTQDPVTRCQYIVAGSSMFPRLDSSRVHICHDLPPYKLSNES